MKERDLIPGDIIFFENNYLNADGQHSHDYIDHVAMYDGLNEHGLPMVIHSITSERGYYYPEKASGLCKTTLRALTNQVQKEADSLDETAARNYAMGIVFCLRSWTTNKDHQCARL